MKRTVETYGLLGPMYGGGFGRRYGLQRSLETLKTFFPFKLQTLQLFISVEFSFSIQKKVKYLGLRNKEPLGLGG